MRIRRPYVTLVCEQCGKAFSVQYCIAKLGRKHCTKACSRTADRGTAKDFWAKVDTSGDVGACWNWKGATVDMGYGRARYEGKEWKAHRLSWTLTYGEILFNLFVCHKCDNPSCCNPNHLFLGTAADNRHDQQAKMRHNYGENVNTNKLSEKQIIEIRERFDNAEIKYGLHSSMAREYGVTSTAIRLIVLRKCWKHLK